MGSKQFLNTSTTNRKKMRNIATVIIVSSLVTLTPGAPSLQQSKLAERLSDVSSSFAPEFWSAECGGRTYTGTYTVMMDWPDCRDYCQSHHSAQFADILDSDTMGCLRFNMKEQYSPGNGYAGHYWAGGYKGEDGQYRWDSGEQFHFNDFIDNPGNKPFIHLTSGNNYKWNLKSDRNDRNNGCLCKQYSCC